MGQTSYKKTVRWHNINTYQNTFSKNEYDRTIDKVMIFNNLKNISQIRQELNIIKKEHRTEHPLQKTIRRSKSTNDLHTLSNFNNLPIFFSPIPFIE
jgi:hypothetical protein